MSLTPSGPVQVRKYCHCLLTGRPARLRVAFVAAFSLAAAVACCVWAAGPERRGFGEDSSLESDGGGSGDGWSAAIAEYHRTREGVVKHTENFVSCVAKANGVPQAYSKAMFQIDKLLLSVLAIPD